MFGDLLTILSVFTLYAQFQFKPDKIVFNNV